MDDGDRVLSKRVALQVAAEYNRAPRTKGTRARLEPIYESVEFEGRPVGYSVVYERIEK